MQRQGQLAVHVVISKAVYVQDLCCTQQDLGLKKLYEPICDGSNLLLRCCARRVDGVR